MSSTSTSGPGALRIAPGEIELNAGKPVTRLVFLNTGDRPIQIGSHIHLPDVNAQLHFDRTAAQGTHLDIPSGTSQRFEPGASRVLDVVPFGGAGRVPGIQIKPAIDEPVTDEPTIDKGV